MFLPIKRLNANPQARSSINTDRKNAKVKDRREQSGNNSIGYWDWLDIEQWNWFWAMTYPSEEVSSSVEPSASNVTSSFGRRSPVNNADVPRTKI